MAAMTPTVIRKYEDLEHQLILKLEKKSMIVGIDGWAGIGKTFVADKLAKTIRANVFHFDDYLAEKKGGYVSFIDVVRLGKDIENLQQEGKPSLVEGVCLLAVLQRMKLKVDLLVYIKEVTTLGLWNQRDWCEPNDDPDAPIRDLQKILGKGPNLETEVAEYHQRFKPTGQASMIFEKLERSAGGI